MSNVDKTFVFRRLSAAKKKLAVELGLKKRRGGVCYTSDFNVACKAAGKLGCGFDTVYADETSKGPKMARHAVEDGVS